MTRPARAISRADFVRAEYLKNLRLGLNLSQEYVAEAIGTSTNSIYKLEDAQILIANSSLFTVAKYAHLYGVTIDDIFSAGGRLKFVIKKAEKEV